MQRCFSPELSVNIYLTKSQNLKDFFQYTFSVERNVA